MRKVLIGTAVLMIGGLTLPKYLEDSSLAAESQDDPCQHHRVGK
jgi:hypothetical protein